MIHAMLEFFNLLSMTVAAPLPLGSQLSQPGAPWGLARISHKLWTYSQDAGPLDTSPNNAYYYYQTYNPVTVYMSDTGVDVNHPEFGGRASWGYNFVSSTNTDDNGHGTHLAGIAIGSSHGVARNASLVAVKILDSNREGNISDFSKAVDWVINDHKTRGGKAVINYSAVGESSSFREEAIQRATSNGIFVVNAAGNNNSDSCNYGPSNLGPSFEGFLTIGASNWTTTPATFSNTGYCIDLWAPGVNIQSSLPGNKYGYMDGTSQSAAFVSGLVAYSWGENPSLSSNDMMLLARSANSNASINTPYNTTGSIAYNYDA